MNHGRRHPLSSVFTPSRWLAPRFRMAVPYHTTDPTFRACGAHIYVQRKLRTRAHPFPARLTVLVVRARCLVTSADAAAVVVVGVDVVVDVIAVSGAPGRSHTPYAVRSHHLLRTSSSRRPLETVYFGWTRC